MAGVGSGAAAARQQRAAALPHSRNLYYHIHPPKLRDLVAFQLIGMGSGAAAAWQRQAAALPHGGVGSQKRRQKSGGPGQGGCHGGPLTAKLRRRAAAAASASGAATIGISHAGTGCGQSTGGTSGGKAEALLMADSRLRPCCQEPGRLSKESAPMLKRFIVRVMYALAAAAALSTAATAAFSAAAAAVIL